MDGLCTVLILLLHHLQIFRCQIYLLSFYTYREKGNGLRPIPLDLDWVFIQVKECGITGAVAGRSIGCTAGVPFQYLGVKEIQFQSCR